MELHFVAWQLKRHASLEKTHTFTEKTFQPESEELGSLGCTRRRGVARTRGEKWVLRSAWRNSLRKMVGKMSRKFLHPKKIQGAKKQNSASRSFQRRKKPNKNCRSRAFWAPEKEPLGLRRLLEEQKTNAPTDTQKRKNNGIQRMSRNKTAPEEQEIHRNALDDEKLPGKSKNIHRKEQNQKKTGTPRSL